MKETFYKKVGRRYLPVREYDEALMNSLPKGAHLIMCYPGGMSCRYNVNPNYATMIAAGRLAGDVIRNAMINADSVQPPRRAMTEEETAAWNNLIAVWGEEARTLSKASIHDIVEAGVNAMIKEADQLMKHQSVRQAYDHFNLMCKLSAEETL